MDIWKGWAIVEIPAFETSWPYSSFIKTWYRLKELINKFIKKNEIILEFLEHTARNYRDVDYMIPQFNDFLARSQFNIGLGLEYLKILQLSNDEEIFNQFDLEDIQNLFSSLLKTQKYNLEGFVEAANFEYSVMDNKIDARRIAESGISNANEKIEELQKLLHAINKDS